MVNTSRTANEQLVRGNRCSFCLKTNLWFMGIVLVYIDFFRLHFIGWRHPFKKVTDFMIPWLSSMFLLMGLFNRQKGLCLPCLLPCGLVIVFLPLVPFVGYSVSRGTAYSFIAECILTLLLCLGKIAVNSFLDYKKKPPEASGETLAEDPQTPVPDGESSEIQFTPRIRALVIGLAGSITSVNLIVYIYATRFDRKWSYTLGELEDRFIAWGEMTSGILAFLAGITLSVSASKESKKLLSVYCQPAWAILTLVLFIVWGFLLPVTLDVQTVLVYLVTSAYIWATVVLAHQYYKAPPQPEHSQVELQEIVSAEANPVPANGETSNLLNNPPGGGAGVVNPPAYTEHPPEPEQEETGTMRRRRDGDSSTAPPGYQSPPATETVNSPPPGYSEVTGQTSDADYAPSEISEAPSYASSLPSGHLRIQGNRSTNNVAGGTPVRNQV